MEKRAFDDAHDVWGVGGGQGGMGSVHDAVTTCFRPQAGNCGRVIFRPQVRRIAERSSS